MTAETLVACETAEISGGGIALSIDLAGDKDGLSAIAASITPASSMSTNAAQHDIFDFWEPIYSRGAQRTDPRSG